MEHTWTLQVPAKGMFYRFTPKFESLLLTDSYTWIGSHWEYVVDLEMAMHLFWMWCVFPLEQPKMINQTIKWFSSYQCLLQSPLIFDIPLPTPKDRHQAIVYQVGIWLRLFPHLRSAMDSHAFQAVWKRVEERLLPRNNFLQFQLTFW